MREWLNYANVWRIGASNLWNYFTTHIIYITSELLIITGNFTGVKYPKVLGGITKSLSWYLNYKIPYIRYV